MYIVNEYGTHQEQLRDWPYDAAATMILLSNGANSFRINPRR